MSAILIVGLGNPGREYQQTRHNVGFRAVTALSKRWGFPFSRQKARAEVADGVALDRRVILGKPQTYMNSSGESVRGLMRLGNLSPSDVLILYDDMDLPFGRLRLREAGSAGGHRGVQSVIDQLGTNAFPRLRIGVGRPPSFMDPIDYVLQPFTASDVAELPDVFERVAIGVEIIIREGVTAAMNVLNAAPKPPPAATVPPPEASR